MFSYARSLRWRRTTVFSVSFIPNLRLPCLSRLLKHNVRPRSAAHILVSAQNILYVYAPSCTHTPSISGVADSLKAYAFIKVPHTRSLVPCIAHSVCSSPRGVSHHPATSVPFRSCRPLRSPCLDARRSSVNLVAMRERQLATHRLSFN